MFMGATSGNNPKKHICVGLLAHVDAGKTTLSEGLLYRTGAISRLGRVDHRDAFLDTDDIERSRGITIFSKQAIFDLPTARVTLLDTPGHVDFSAETERTLQVLDCAVLVVSAPDGVQGHTQTLWRLLRRRHIPVFLFINKMDLPTAGRETVMEQLRARLDEGCVDFTQPVEGRDEELATCDEGALDCFLDQGQVPEERIARLVREGKVFPCYFGSALKLEGVDELLSGLERFAPRPQYPEVFAARVFKITRDPQGKRLTWMKITGGALKVKTPLSGGSGEGRWEEKADQLRLYSGERFAPVQQVEAGQVCAVTGLTRTYPGQGLGAAEEGDKPVLEPVLTYQILLPDGCDPHTALAKLSQLEEEDPQLHLVWDEHLGQLHVQLMGQVQLEVLQKRIASRFGWEVSFGTGGIVYRETIESPALGVGHFEPLRHYAEVHLLLEPGERGSGVQVGSACSADTLDLNWQRLILTHLTEREHPGVLTGFPVTDLRITLLAGRAHLKHTEGGDFRQATYRAVRQGLMGAKCVLLEPWYDFRLELPPENVGRAMTDIQQMGGQPNAPETVGETVLLTGGAPVAGLRDYWKQVAAYTHGRGRLSCTVQGYRPCADQERVVEALGYDPERDVLNPTGSVFCAHGAGFVVPWDQVPRYAHMDLDLPLGKKEERSAQAADQPSCGERPLPSLEQDKQLQAIFERTYGRTEPRSFQSVKKPARTSLDEAKYAIREQKTGPEYLLVDGYNIIFAWEELTAVARENVDAARAMLTDILVDYRGVRKCEVILVFDAYKVKGNPGSIEKTGGIYVVYTKEAETADAYIEKATYDLGREHRVRVATSDALEQVIILGHGALRLSARSFHQEVEQTRGQIARFIQEYNRRSREQNKLQYTANITRRKGDGKP